MSTDDVARAATFDLDAMVRFADLAVADLADAREEIDALNVYPVPDGDTGTNLFLTVESARDALRAKLAEDPADPFRDGLAGFARGALLGARGNSGVILSQLFGALFRRMAAAGPDDRAARVYADGMVDAADAAYAAVGEPVEGTILTVARAAAVAADEVATRPDTTLVDVLQAAAERAREALAQTPEQMPLLKEAGVVDAGGQGLCVVLDAAAAALTGQLRAVRRRGQHVRPLPSGDLTPEGPAYEVMYLLDAEDDAIPALRADLQPLGDSLVVVGGEGLWNVHVHVDDVGLAVEAGIRAGTPRRIRVTHFAEQPDRSRTPLRTGRTVVAVVAGEGLAKIFGEAGAHVIPGGPGRRPSTGELLEAIERSGASEVIVLPNDADSLAVAEAAARAAADTGVHVVVVPTRAQVQGIAAIAVHDPGRALDADVVQMTAAAGGTRHGAVTVAAKRAMTTAGPCEPGDVLGVVAGDFAVVGDDHFTVAVDVLTRLLAGGGELVTVVAGEDAGDLPERCEEWVAREHPDVEVLLLEGGQARYPLLLSVE